MNIKELKEIIKDLPDDAEVKIRSVQGDQNGIWAHVYKVEIYEVGLKQLILE